MYFEIPRIHYGNCLSYVIICTSAYNFYVSCFDLISLKFFLSVPDIDGEIKKTGYLSYEKRKVYVEGGNIQCTWFFSFTDAKKFILNIAFTQFMEIYRDLQTNTPIRLCVLRACLIG